MATVQVNIDINDEEFKTLCLENINDLPKDKMQDIFLKAVETALIADKNSTSTAPYYGREGVLANNVNGRIEPTQIMKDIMNEISIKKYLDPVAEEVANYLKENYKEMIKRYIIEAITGMLFSNEKVFELRDQIMRDISKY